jgi:hypothetical protein
VGGIRLRRSGNHVLDNVVVSGFSGSSSYGIYEDGVGTGGSVNEYPHYQRVNAHDCKVGVKVEYTSGLNWYGGYLDGHSNTGTVATGTTGVLYGTGCGTSKFFGLRIQQYDTGMNITQGNGEELHGCRFECFGTTALIMDGGTGYGVFGGSWSNFQNSSGGTAIQFGTTAVNPIAFPAHITSVATRVSDLSGTAIYTDGNKNLFLPNTGTIQWGTGDTKLQRLSSGQLLITNNAYVNSALVLNNSNGAGAKAGTILFGSAQTLKEAYGTGSPEGVITAAIGSTYRRTDGGALTSFYVKESGTGNTGWVGK